MTTNSLRALAIVSGCVLVGIGLVVGWITAVAVVAIGLLVWLGYQCAGEKLSLDRARLKAQRKALDAEWRALEQTGRVRSMFLHAQRAMQQEAQQWPTTDPGQGGR